VTLHFGNQSPWSSANEKEIDSLVAWLIPTLGLPDLVTCIDLYATICVVFLCNMSVCAVIETKKSLCEKR